VLFDAHFHVIDQATGFGRLDFGVASALRDLVRESPDAVVFGTDLPSTRAPRPFAPIDIDLVRQALGEALATRVLHENALAICRPA
jgi:predicted TIM-barrel fold metal-dependent hydrolase